MVKRRSHEREEEAPNSKRGRPVVGGGEDRTVFVGHLSPQTSWQDLKDHMRRAGNVDSANILKQNHPSSRGRCALVDYQDPREAQRAIRELHNSVLHGNRIEVRLDQKPGSKRDGAAATKIGTGSETSIYVGNLAYECTWQNLKDEFRRFGPVEHASIAELPNGRSKGYGLVSMRNKRDAEKAIRTLDGATVQGRSWYVRLDRQSNEVAAGGSGEAASAASCSLFVGNLPFDCTWQQLKDYFRKCGPVSHVEIAESSGGHKKGYGIVSFETARDAAKAIRTLDGGTFQGRPLQVREDRKDKSDTSPQTAGGKRTAADLVDSGVSDTIFVKNLSFDTKAEDLKRHFKSIGTIKRAEVMMRDGGTKSKGWGLVQFAKPEQAERAIEEQDGIELQGRKLEIRLDIKGESSSQSRNKEQKSKEKSMEPEYDHDMALGSALKSSR